jgi:uncharacterized membrane protein YGL010W
MDNTMSKTSSDRTQQLETWFQEYEADHVDARNKLTHFVGIPMIAFAVIRLFQKVQLGPTNLALLLIVALFVFFFKHDKRLSVLLVATLMFFYVLGYMLSLSTLMAWGLFVVGWALQLVGHYVYEKRAPAFMKNLLHLLIGPVWILARVSGMR